MTMSDVNEYAEAVRTMGYGILACVVYYAIRVWRS